MALASWAFVLATAGVPNAQVPAEPPVVMGEMVQVSLQQLYVTVTNRRGKRVIDLDRESFTVTDDGVRQEIVTFAGGEIPLTAVLVVDGSASMKGEPLRAAGSGVESFARGIKELDLASVLVFSDRLLSRTAFANTPDEVLSGLEALEAEGGSAVHDHLYLALKMLEERQGRRVVLLLSDGFDGHSVVSFEQLETVARVSQSLVYWVRVRQRSPVRASSLMAMSWVGPVEGEREYRRLEKLVKQSGGRIVEIDRVTDAESAFGEVLRELREQYAIGYYPSPPHDGSGRFRPVKIEIAQPGFKARSRAGYVDR